MKDIGVYTTEETLNHKRNGSRMYWTIPFGGYLSIEEKCEEEAGEASTDSATSAYNPIAASHHHPKRIWFATGGYWQGYFDVWDVEGNDIIFYSEHWHSIKHPKEHPRKPFRGFTYKVPE